MKLIHHNVRLSFKECQIVLTLLFYIGKIILLNTIVISYSMETHMYNGKFFMFWVVMN
jgi:hypothetical protein